MIEIIITSSILILCILVIRKFFMNRISAVLQYSLWLLVLVRLIFPFSFPGSPVSVMNAVPEYSQNSTNTNAPFIQAPLMPAKPSNTQFSQPQFQENYIPPDSNNTLDDRINNTNPIRLIFIIWLSVFIVILAQIIINNIMFSRKVRRDAVLLYNIDCILPVYMMRDLPSPCLFGVIKPIIIISPGAEDQELLKYVLAHELCHYKYKDNWVSLLRSLCCAVYWFNPLVWIAARASKIDCEMACDERVVKRFNDRERINYGAALLSLIQGKTDKLLSLSTAAAGNDMKRRITMIAKKRKTVVITVLLCLMLIVTIGAITFTGAEAKSNSIQDEKVPNVNGKSEEDALALLQDADFDASLITVESAEISVSPTVTPATTAKPEPVTSSEIIISADASQLAYEQRIPDFFAANNGWGFMDEAYNNNFFVTLDEPVVSDSNGVTLALHRYILTGERSVFRFKVSGMPDDKIKIKFNTEAGTYTSNIYSPPVQTNLKLRDGNGKTLFDSDTDISLNSDLYETEYGVFLELTIGEKNNSNWGEHLLEIPDILKIEIDKVGFIASDTINGQWEFTLPVDDMFKNVKPLYYEVTNSDFCNDKGIYVDKFYSTITATRMRITIDNTKNSIVQSKLDNDIILFKDPKTHNDKRPYEQKLFVEANGEQLFGIATYIGPDGSQSEGLSKLVTNYYWTQKTDKETQFFIYLPTLYFANAENVIVRILDENRNPIEANLRLIK